jgi:hypothetical protein
MSRTRRRPLPPFARGDYDEDFKNDMKRGHVSISKRGPSGGMGDEVWGARGKRYTKRHNNRQQRRKNKRIDVDEE